ncbi:MAG: hypothetical protein IJA78_00295 [Clostridia bacterium]|nr:hypothetical protein [Clostridia bacterium]
MNSKGSSIVFENATNLLKLFSEKNMSKSTIEQIIFLLTEVKSNPSQYEKRLVEITDMVRTSNTEEEFLEKLQNGISTMTDP